MGDKWIFILGAIILCMAMVIAGYMAKMRRIRQNLKKLERALDEIGTEGVNRKILIKESDLFAPLFFQVNHIIYDYEKKLQGLRAAEETSKELMTSLSHDVRTPLTTLIGYLDAVRGGIVHDQEREEYLEIARRRAYDLKVYIDVLFDWFRLNSNEWVFSLKGAEIAELTRNILKDWIPVFREKEVVYDIEIPNGPIMVKVDVDGYARIVNNLVQNALSHSHGDEIKIKLEALEGKVKICIRDNGVGIAGDDLRHIFDRLYKCDRGRSEKGSGLGLAIVRQMVEKMKGEISADSRLGEYTEFIVELPLAAER